MQQAKIEQVNRRTFLLFYRVNKRQGRKNQLLSLLL